MKSIKVCTIVFIAFFISASFVPVAVWAGDIPDPDTYLPTWSEIRKHKKLYDDPSPWLKTFGPKQVLPAAMYEKLTFDIDEMKDLWAELVGFRAPDVVGKIAPEIKPGKYTYKDKEKYPGLKELMWPLQYDRIKPGGPPHAGCIPEFEIIPTRQYYYPLPISKATNRNLGKAKLDKDGYLITETWEGGLPFPRPSGKFKGQQIMYNIEKKYTDFGQNYYAYGHMHGYTKRLNLDFDGAFSVLLIRAAGRILFEPYGWLDGRAEKRGEANCFVLNFLAPRDIAGAAQGATYYLDPRKTDQLMMYIPSLRRIRKMSATDSQDPAMGMDAIYDDNDGWKQKLSPIRYPYKFEVIDEREFLVVAATLSGAEYYSSEGLEFRNIRFERRPCWVLKLTQLDPNYVYGHRIFYIDKENLYYHHVENYDQKGRLYRTWTQYAGFIPEMGTRTRQGELTLGKDFIDLHCTIGMPYMCPTNYARNAISLKGLLKRAK